MARASDSAHSNRAKTAKKSKTLKKPTTKKPKAIVAKKLALKYETSKVSLPFDLICLYVLAILLSKEKTLHYYNSI